MQYSTIKLDTLENILKKHNITITHHACAYEKHNDQNQGVLYTKTESWQPPQSYSDWVCTYLNGEWRCNHPHILFKILLNIFPPTTTLPLPSQTRPFHEPTLNQALLMQSPPHFLVCGLIVVCI